MTDWIQWKSCSLHYFTVIYVPGSDSSCDANAEINFRPSSAICFMWKWLKKTSRDQRITISAWFRIIAAEVVSTIPRPFRIYWSPRELFLNTSRSISSFLCYWWGKRERVIWVLYNGSTTVTDFLWKCVFAENRSVNNCLFERWMFPVNFEPNIFLNAYAQGLS